MRFIYLTFVASFFMGSLLQAQTITSVNDPIVYSGSCTNFQNNSGGTQPTAIWIDQNLILNNFSSTLTLINDFEIYFGDTGDQTQGIAVSIQQVGNTAIGDGGQSMGYGGAGFTPAITFEMDTELGAHDSYAGGNQHLALKLNGQYDQAPPASGLLSLPNMLDGNTHHGVLTLYYDPSNTANQYVRFTLDGTYTLTYYIEFASIFNLATPIYIGGTSAPVGNNPNSAFASQGAPGDPGTCSAVTFPIELLSFDGKMMESDKVKLYWETAKEENFSHFMVERSLDQNLWEPTGKVNGTGNSEQVRAYQFIDQVTGNGTYFYRLKHVDIDGRFDYSDVLSVNVDEVPLHLKPNPATDMVRIDLGNIQDDFSYIDIEILDIQGKAVYQERVSTANRAKEIPVSGLMPGMYLVKVAGNTKIVWSERLIVR